MGHLLMHSAHKGGIESLGAELHHHTLAHLHCIIILLRHAVGVGTVYV